MSALEKPELIQLPDKGNMCQQCKKHIFALLTPSGGDYVTCPLCGNGCLCCGFSTLDYDSDCEIDEHYCNGCNILFNIGCTHSVNGCTDGIYYGKLIKSYTYQNITYDGMPKFKSFTHMFKILPHIKKINWQCMCYISNCKSCTHAFYPEKDYDMYYTHTCDKLCRKKNDS